MAYYPFNGNANDESGNGNDGTVYGATLTSDRFGNPDSAYSFDGIDDYIDIGNNVKPPFPVSVSVWVNANDLDPSHGSIVVRNDQYDSGSYRYGLAVGVSDGYLVSYYFEGFSAPWNRIGYISNDVLISEGNWHHLVVILNAHKNIQLFVNGVEHLGSYDDGTGSGMSYSGSGNGAIGMYKSGSYRYFNGIVDELRFYNRALSESEIQELYEGVPFLDLKVNGSDGPISITTSDNANVTVSLDPGGFSGVACDWWIGALTPYGNFWLSPWGWLKYDWPISLGQYPLFDLSETSLLDTPLPVGIYTLFFALDDTPDGQFDMTWQDYVNVIVKGEGTASVPDLDTVFQGNAKPLVE